MSRTYRTPKGTDLPLLNLRGKEYLEVKFRLVWFREEHPDWSIETTLLSVTPESAYARAEIKDEQRRVVATSHKYEDRKGFPDFIEKAETGAIGRALALCGYGTQFCADELDEGERIVDSPIEKKPKEPAIPPSLVESGPEDPGDHVIGGGKRKNQKLRSVMFEVGLPATEKYIHSLESLAQEEGRALRTWERFLKVAFERYRPIYLLEKQAQERGEIPNEEWS